MYRSLCFVLFPLILFCGCQNASKHPPEKKITVFSSNVMTIDYRILLGKTLSDEQQARVESVIRETFAEINAVYNKWNPDSELSKLNRLKANEKASLSPQLENFLLLTQQIVQITEGRFDPTIEPIQKLWKQKLLLGKVPTQEEIDALAPAVGWNKIHFKNGEFYKDHDLASLDLGGIAKGFCVDLLVERLNAEGYPDLYVEWGGEIRCSGQHPDGRPWNIFISRFGDPNPENAIAVVSLINEAIATSGDYLQSWSVEGKSKAQKITYFHIFDPKSYRPLESTATSVASASVVAPTCVFADGLATAAMMFPTVEEAKLWSERVHEQFPEMNLKFWFATRKKEENGEKG